MTVIIETDAERLAMLTAVGGIEFRAPRGRFVGVLGDDYLASPGEAADVETSSLLITCRTSDVASLKVVKGDELRVGLDSYVVIGHRPDGTGITVLQVHRT